MNDQDWTDLENEVGRKLPSTEEDLEVRRMSDQTREVINNREGAPRELPRVVGLCQNLSHADEFYMPDPKPGETCPWCDLKLIHFKRTTYRLERFAG